MNGVTPIDAPRSQLNETAIREHALRCSKLYRAGKFTRVGGDFMQEVSDDVESFLRKIRNEYQTLHPALSQNAPIDRNPGSESDPELAIIKGYFLERVESELNRWLCRLIQNKVQRQPTVGVTLGRTR